MEQPPRLSLEGVVENMLQPLDPLRMHSNLVLAIIQSDMRERKKPNKKSVARTTFITRGLQLKKSQDEKKKGT